MRCGRGWLAICWLFVGPWALASPGKLARTLDEAQQDLEAGDARHAVRTLQAVDAAGLDRPKYEAQRPRYYRLRGLAYLGVGSHFEATQDLTMAINHQSALGTVDPSWYVELGLAQYHEGNCGPALGAFDKAGETAHHVTDAWVQRAHCYRELGKPEAAKTAADEGLARHPTTMALYRERALALLAIHEMPHAVEAAAQYVRDTTELDAHDVLHLARAFRTESALDAARSVLEHGLQRFPGERALELQHETIVGEIASRAPASVTSRTEPTPSEATQEGYVVARIWVTAEGKVERVTIVESKPPGVFDEVAHATLSQWTFDPATVDGQRVASEFEHRMTFP